MTQLIYRPANTRGQIDAGWLLARHSFSFGEYRDREWMRFGNLRVLNDDIIQPNQGFDTHPHQNAEIFSYVLEGELAHKDSMGNGSVVAAGGIQYMSAGSGVMHSEFNPSTTQQTRLLQVWLLPAVTGTTPRYQNIDVNPTEKAGQLTLFLSHDGRDASIQSHADADVYCATLDANQRIEIQHPERKGWIQAAKGSLTVNEQTLHEGDGLGITGAMDLVFANGQQTDFLYFVLGD